MPRKDYLSLYQLSSRFFTKGRLSLYLTVLILGTVVTLWSGGKVSYLMPGGLSSPHRLFETNCMSCHTVWQRVSDKSCLKCHDRPVHDKNQLVTPICTTCHSEHEGDISLASVNDQSCIQCHTNLQTKDRTLHFGNKIQSFNNGHPEFKISVRKTQGTRRVGLDETAHLADLARMKFNHYLHLKADLRGPNGPVQLLCKNCHRAAVDGVRMAPVTYQMDCKTCHDLSFDPNAANRLVPHAPPEEVRAYLMMAITDHYAGRREPEHARRLPGNPSSPRPALPSQVSQGIIETERLLYNVTCNKCHTLDKNHVPFPKVEKTAIPIVWFPHARFKHETHHQLKCVSCHQNVSKSRATTDVLLPGIQVCQNCHRPDRARADCVTCHLYHEPSEKRTGDGLFTIPHLLKGEREKTSFRTTETQP